MGLEIEFLEGPPTMVVGHTTPLRVLQLDASRTRTQIALADVEFIFAPNAWGRVSESPDPATGILEVIALVETNDPLLEPTYEIRAALQQEGGQSIPRQKKIRLVPTAFEVELAFEIGVAGSFRRFSLADLSTPIDWSLARVTDPSTQTIVVRDGVPYLRVNALDALPSRIEITFPNGELATLMLEGVISARGLSDTKKMPGIGPPPPTPVIQSEVEHEQSAVEDEAPFEPPAAAAVEAPVIQPPVVGSAPPAAQPSETAPEVAPETATDLREEIVRMRRYVSSFAGSLAVPDPERVAKTRARIRERLETVRPRVDAYAGADREEIAAQFAELWGAGQSA